MSITFPLPPAPLVQDANGDIRVGDSRVLLDMVVHAFQDGATPEEIVQRYSTLQLRDVYAAIAYYLHHEEEVTQYLANRDQRAQQLRNRLPNSEKDLSRLRQDMLKRRP